MSQLLHYFTLFAVLAPLAGGLLAGLYGKQLGKQGTHWVTILGVAISFVLSLAIFKLLILGQASPYNGNVYTWAISGNLQFNIGFLVDKLTAIMMLVVTFVSLLVHIYTIGYMADDPGYQRFFSYISCFTFAMLMLVTANNFLQLFFGWEGVGLISYLLIGFWFKRESANLGSFKAFLANRVGDFGFILGIAAILDTFGSVDYQTVFAQLQQSDIVNQTMTLLPGMQVSVITVIAILLFIGAMGKSAQIPLHVWLPESMEGPTPISALIHAATMVTAGVFLVARMSGLFELSPVALSVVLVVGATGALFMGLLGITQYDIKRVVAYSTLSQLGYMMAAEGASAYQAGIFHLVTHAAFKALLFLAAGSVIIGMHHEQDMRKMGGLRNYMPVTYVTFFIGALSLSAIPPFSGFFSKDAIIEAIHLSTIPGAGYAYILTLLGAFVTALYTFRAFFLTFHTKPRMDNHTKERLQESPWVVWLPLVILAVPSTVLGGLWIEPMLFKKTGLLGQAITVLPAHDVLGTLGEHYHGAWAMVKHAFYTAPFWLSLGGIFVAWLFCAAKPQWSEWAKCRFALPYRILVNKYGFDDFNEVVLVRNTRRMADYFFYVGDLKFIDGFFVNGSGRFIDWLSRVGRKMQSGYLYHYAFAMIVGLLVFLAWFIL